MAKLDLEVVVEPHTGAGLAARFPASRPDRHQAMRELVNILHALVGGGMRGRVRMRVDDSVGVKASGTIACSQANVTVGDKLEIDEVVFTAVTGVADATLGQFSKDTSDTAVATSLALAINTYAPTRLGQDISATSSTGTVTVTAKVPGSVGNALTMKKIVTVAGAFTLSGATLSGGIDGGARQSLTATLGGVGTANDTLTIGSIVLTLVASAANENQVTIGGSATLTAAAIAAAINAHSKLKGLVSATSAAAVVTITFCAGGRMGALVAVSKVSTAITLSAASFAPSTTETYVAGLQQYDFGVP